MTKRQKGGYYDKHRSKCSIGSRAGSSHWRHNPGPEGHVKRLTERHKKENQCKTDNNADNKMKTATIDTHNNTKSKEMNYNMKNNNITLESLKASAAKNNNRITASQYVEAVGKQSTSDKAAPAHYKRPRGQPEHVLQASMVQWFKENIPAAKAVLFAVPNGGYRCMATAAAMKREGQLPGASDLVLVTLERTVFIEVKTPTGKQSEAQKRFQQHVELLEYQYYIVRSLDEFKEVVRKYV